MRTLGLIACVACIALAACRFSGPDGATIDGSPGGEVTIPDDAPDAPPDARQCFGTGLGMVCLASAPTMPLVLDGTIDTGIDASCREVIAVGGTMSCVLAGTTVEIASGNTYHGIGSRPLVIVASGVMTIDGTLNVGSTRAQLGAGASSAAASVTTCAAPGAGEADGGGGGGAAGGSFAGDGGDGGNGDINGNGQPQGPGDGGNHAAAVSTLTILRAGCPGGIGGTGNGNASTLGAPGPGGGAVYLISGAEIRIAGMVTAAGAGGGGGGERAGGGGGGSGGLIGLDAPIVNVSGRVTANGGGGGEGGGFGPNCDPGDDATTDGMRAPGGADPITDSNDGGNGGSGSGGGTGGAANGGGGNQDTGGGGGGGGGAGIIYVRGALSSTGATISPTASTN